MWLPSDWPGWSLRWGRSSRRGCWPARGTRNVANKTGQYIECGMEPIGDAWIRYSAVYYLYAIVFVAFAVDVLFLIPVALVYNREATGFPSAILSNC